MGFFKIGEAFDELTSATGAKDTALAGAKLVGKTIFNTGKLAVDMAVKGVEIQSGKKLRSDDLNVEQGEKLRESRGKVNNIDENGYALLESAIYPEFRKDVLEQLIADGADVNARRSDLRSILRNYWDLKEVAELLIANGADVNAKDDTGWTTLHMASSFGGTEVAELLIANGADVNAIENDLGWTPLHCAAHDSDKNSGCTKIVELLINNGAIINIKDLKGRTPLNLASQKGNNDSCDLLLKHGGTE